MMVKPKIIKLVFDASPLNTKVAIRSGKSEDRQTIQWL
jgi:hypothetical protein